MPANRKWLIYSDILINITATWQWSWQQEAPKQRWKSNSLLEEIGYPFAAFKIAV